VDPRQQAFVRQGVQIVAHGVLAHAKRLGEGRDTDGIPVLQTG
jgi:hypothetical protein